MRYINLKTIEDVNMIDYTELQETHNDKNIIVEVNESIGSQMLKNMAIGHELVEGKYFYETKEKGVWIALDTFCRDMEHRVVETRSDSIAVRYLDDRLTLEEIEEENAKQIQKEKDIEEYKQGILPKYFDIKEKNVTGSLIKIDLDELIKHEFTEDEDGIHRGRFYWDYCEKFLKLCGCENIDMQEIVCRDDYRVSMDVVIALNNTKEEGILHIMFNDDYIDREVKKILEEKEIQIPRIDKEFILKKKFELGTQIVFEVTELDFF